MVRSSVLLELDSFGGLSRRCAEMSMDMRADFHYAHLIGAGQTPIILRLTHDCGLKKGECAPSNYLLVLPRKYNRYVAESSSYLAAIAQAYASFYCY